MFTDTAMNVVHAAARMVNMAQRVLGEVLVLAACFCGRCRT